MSTPSAVHLHVHSEYSLLDGACKIEALAARCAELGMPALGLTDHGVLNGAVEFYKACRKHGVKPILGLEAYLVDDRHEREKVRYERNHLTLLARDETGFKNLIKLSSLGYLDGFRRGQANVDMELLDRHSEGVIALSGCLQSRFCQRIVQEREQEARSHAEDLMGVFGAENVYFEVQNNKIPEQDRANEGIVRIAREVGRPLVGTADVHYLRREDYSTHSALLCVQTKSTLAQPKLRFDTNEFFLKSPEEMAGAFAEWPEAVPTSLEIAERCEIELELDKMMLPTYPTPDGAVPTEYLRRLTEQGLRERYGDPPPAAAVERLQTELRVIEDMGFESYFLIVWDFVKYAKDNGIAVGPGRGSAAGSIVSYVLRITDVDPLASDLMFERFLNAERKTMPDIDIDFSIRGRERVIRYVQDKYGKDAVAQIITFGKMKPRAATRDAARVLGVDYATGDRLAKLIPEPIMGRTPSFDECLAPGTELRKAYDTEPQAQQVVDVARGLEGIVRNNSIHAAAVVIADRPLTDLVPLQLAEDRGAPEVLADGENGIGGKPERVYKTVTQYSMKPIEEIGLLKMDFLGLRTLDVLENAVAIIERSGGEQIDLANLPLDDRKTFEMLARGDSVGVFQLESEGMQEALREVGPTDFDDIVALVALYRPGPMRFIKDYARGKRDPATVRYIDERLRHITESTYGIAVYQEQLMQIARDIAGFPGPKADTLRRAIGKKERALMATLKEDFVNGSCGGGTTKPVANQLWGLMEAAADYSFNKCAHRETRVILPDGQRVRLSEAYRSRPREIMAMWPDGQIRPHRVQKIVRTGQKELLHVKTASGRQIKATADHRLMTTAGYEQIGQMTVGTELITLPMISEKQREARRLTMRKLARRPERKAQDKRAAKRMRAYQARRSREEKVAHMRRMHALHPNLTRAGTAAMHERIKWLHANDPEWRRRQIEKSFATVRAAYDTGPGYGHCSIASNGMWCASNAERQMCEWLISQEIDFEMHKTLPNGRMCDFYFDGTYWEMDGMDRSSKFFDEKYDDLPYVVVTPEDFKLVIEARRDLDHVENGDPIVSIEPAGRAMTYDIEMAPDGPLNYIANGIVSHNSHAACYGLIAYRTAFLKANYPAEYMAALISSVMSTKDKVPFFVSRCDEMGISVLPPDVNASGHDFVVVDRDIRFGLDAVKNVGYSAVEKILEAREKGGGFTSIWDFCSRVDARTVNKKAIESLVKCGALDSTGATRKGMLSVLAQAQASGAKAQDDLISGQGSIFDLEPAGEGGPPAAAHYPPLPTDECDGVELLAMEKETLGIFLSSHPLAEVRHLLRARTDCSLREVGSKPDGAWVTVGGLIVQAKRIRTKSGEPMMFATLDDLEGQVEMLIFNSAYAANESHVGVDKRVIVRGRLDHKERGETKLVVQEIEPFEPTPEEIAAAGAPPAEIVAGRGTRTVTSGLEPVVIKVDARLCDEMLIADLKALLEHFPGQAEVLLEMATTAGSRRLRFGSGYRVSMSGNLRAELDELLGPEALVA